MTQELMKIELKNFEELPEVTINDDLFEITPDMFMDLITQLYMQSMEDFLDLEEDEKLTFMLASVFDLQAGMIMYLKHPETLYELLDDMGMDEMSFEATLTDNGEELGISYKGSIDLQEIIVSLMIIGGELFDYSGITAISALLLVQILGDRMGEEELEDILN